ncbi:imelysin family protein [Actibacterium sp. 188UL27-1]|uniref:imelysin family protein n=1 Tax=Actibacterium sp. 188UL27-1 TaxID=2786961 RepID=UPI00195AA150|nr:imelysin family protein [Actibacterium sp. 188UL27-1]MBM7067086.1 imelysin family protein [Actibacterium sp. 188UL27-1]
MRSWKAAILIMIAMPAWAETPDIAGIVDDHILPGYQALAARTAGLADAAQADCTPGNAHLNTAYHAAFDAWIMVSHLRFGPSEQDDRAFALAFWPDTRGATPKTLAALLRDQDPVVRSPEAFQTVSVAARGFYALELLLYDPQFQQNEAVGYRCTLITTLTQGIAASAAAILDDWEGGYADLMRGAGSNDTYRSPDEAVRQMFTALSSGLEFTAETRLGRPMGTFDKPRPNRAEARRSGRALHHVTLSLTATRDLAAALSGGDTDLDAAFGRAINRATALDDPVLATVATPEGRFRVEVLQQSITDIRQQVAEDLGPRLGIATGFNSLDGD